MKSLREQVGRSLDEIEPSRVTVGRLVASAARHVADAKVKAVSAPTRFGAAYTAVRSLADAALHAHGYRTLSSRPGHHHTAIMSLTLTLGLPAETVRLLDTLRRQRNQSDYDGAGVPESAVATCIEQAEALQARLHAWLKKNRPDLL
jgi:predicted transcriptional regulator